jgi:hypothetical protein
MPNTSCCLLFTCFYNSFQSFVFWFFISFHLRYGVVFEIVQNLKMVIIQAEKKERQQDRIEDDNDRTEPRVAPGNGDVWARPSRG